GTLCHEVSHMWFGDLVTMTWWDDLWLNESFASWLGDRISDQVAPGLDAESRELGTRENALRRDAEPRSRAVRAPIDAFDNIDQRFDALSYDKGESVLEMIEGWIGPESFRTGVRAYIDRHAWGNATGAELWSALATASGRDVAAVARSFLDQPGVPL